MKRDLLREPLVARGRRGEVRKDERIARGIAQDLEENLRA